MKNEEGMKTRFIYFVSALARTGVNQGLATGANVVEALEFKGI